MRLCLRFSVVLAVCMGGLAALDLPAAQQAQAAGSPDVTVQPPCDDGAFDQAMDLIHERGGGSIGFNCGSNATIIFKSQKDIDLDVAIFGGGEITLNGTNSTRLFSVSSGRQLTLSDLTLMNGFGPDGGAAILSRGVVVAERVVFRNNNAQGVWAGGAISNVGGSLQVRNSVFEGNSAADGGAIYSDGNLYLDRVTLSANTARNGHGGALFTLDRPGNVITGSLFMSNTASIVLSRGGAIYLNADLPSTLDIVNTQFKANGAYYGGAIFVNSAATTVLKRALFTGNRATAFGGGIENSGGNVTIAAATFSGNQAEFGSGASNRGHMTIQNATFSGNTSNASGVFLNSDAGNATLTHVTFSNNFDISQDVSAATILQQSSQSVVLRNVALKRGDEGFTDGNCAVFADNAPIMSAGFNVSDDASCATAFTQAGDKNNIDPMLGPLASNSSTLPSHLPVAESPLIDHGQCVDGIATDQRGVARPQGDSCDIGAVEVRAQDAARVFLPMAIR